MPPKLTKGQRRERARLFEESATKKPVLCVRMPFVRDDVALRARETKEDKEFKEKSIALQTAFGKEFDQLKDGSDTKPFATPYAGRIFAFEHKKAEGLTVGINQQALETLLRTNPTQAERCTLNDLRFVPFNLKGIFKGITEMDNVSIVGRAMLQIGHIHGSPLAMLLQSPVSNDRKPGAAMARPTKFFSPVTAVPFMYMYLCVVLSTIRSTNMFARPSGGSMFDPEGKPLVSDEELEAARKSHEAFQEIKAVANATMEEAQQAAKRTLRASYDMLSKEKEIPPALMIMMHYEFTVAMINSVEKAILILCNMPAGLHNEFLTPAAPVLKKYYSDGITGFCHTFTEKIIGGALKERAGLELALKNWLLFSEQCAAKCHVLERPLVVPEKRAELAAKPEPQEGRIRVVPEQPAYVPWVAADIAYQLTFLGEHRVELLRRCAYTVRHALESGKLLLEDLPQIIFDLAFATHFCSHTTLAPGTAEAEEKFSVWAKELARAVRDQLKLELVTDITTLPAGGPKTPAMFEPELILPVNIPREFISGGQTPMDHLLIAAYWIKNS